MVFLHIISIFEIVRENIMAILYMYFFFHILIYILFIFYLKSLETTACENIVSKIYI